jgi:hypothetical protein
LKNYVRGVSFSLLLDVQLRSKGADLAEDSFARFQLDMHQLTAELKRDSIACNK